LWNLLVLDPQFAKNHNKELCTEITLLLVEASKYIKIFRSTTHRLELLTNAAARWDKLTNAAAQWGNLGDQEKNWMMTEVALLDSTLEIARYFKVKWKTLRVDLQIMEDRLKCLKKLLEDLFQISKIFIFSVMSINGLDFHYTLLKCLELLVYLIIILNGCLFLLQFKMNEE